MTNQVFVAPHFLREAKRLNKKYLTLKSSIDKLINDLKLNPHLGESYGKGIFKIRLADKSKGGGKSGGFRVMYYHLEITNDDINILLISIYNKSEKSTIKKDEALALLSDILGDYTKE